MASRAIGGLFGTILLGGLAGTSLLSALAASEQLPYPADRDYLTPGENIRIPLNGGGADELAAELDGIDVTAHLRVENGYAVISPVERLSVGRHDIALYALSGGSIEVLRSSSFVVARGADATQARSGDATENGPIGGGQATGHFAFKGAGSVNTGYIVDSDIEGEEPDRWGADGGMVVAGDWQHGAWSGDIEGDVLLNTRDASLTVDGQPIFEEESEHRTVDLGEYLLNVRRGNVSGRLGHHGIDYDSLVLSNFRRRGFSLNWQAVNDRLDLTGFGFRTTPRSGFDNLSGLGEENDRVVGGLMTMRPFEVGASATELHVTWLEGDSRPERSGAIVGDDFDRAGEAWSVAAASRLADERIELHAELARSDFDFDGDGLERPIEDDAWQLGALYRPIVPDPGSTTFETLELGVDYRHVGTFFRSLANPSLPHDLDRYRVFGNYFKQGLGLNVLLQRQADNTNDLEVLPRTRTDLASMTVSYSPTANIEDQPAWLGLPSFSASWTQSRQEQTRDAPVLDTDADLETRHASLSATFLHETWDWYVSLGDGVIKDNTDRFPDTSDTSAEIGLTFSRWDRARLGVRYQRVRTEEDDTGTVSDEDLAIVDASFALIPRRLELGVSASYNRRQTGGATQARSLITDANLTWIAREATGYKPGVALWLRGQHRDRSGALLVPDADETTWQVMTGLTVDFAIR